MQPNPAPETAIVSASRFRPRATRLIVLVAQDEVDEALLARRIWEAAVPGHSEVLYVALVRNADEEPRVRRSLALLSSLTRDDRLRVSTHVAFQSRWLTALRPLVQRGDAIVCLAEQTVKPWGRAAHPLSEQLAAEFGGAVHVLEGVSLKRASAERKIWPMIRNTVPFAIVVGFLEFQMWIASQVLSSAAGNAVLGLSVMVEFSLIWLWLNRVS